MKITINRVKQYLLDLQKGLIAACEREDRIAVFEQDCWTREQGGGGRTCVLEQGAVFEQAGINFSHVGGTALPQSATAHRPELMGAVFEAVGLSLVIHPRNPFVPTTHMNLRFFMAEKEGQKPVWWFGGGYDLTPYYGFMDDCIHFHRIAKEACDAVDHTLYPTFKQWADEYFFLKHRQEPRGIGGIFFDDFNKFDFETSFTFLKQVGDSFLDAYMPIVNRRKDTPYASREREFQLYRRGRYVEFNLLYDRGTLFGLQSGGRVESILMSLPPVVNWRYNWYPEADTKEAQLYEIYLKARDWI